jgi:deferrochelatase/peroxidase EfeB
LDTDGLDADGELNAGLLFTSYQNDPQHFIRLQTRLGDLRDPSRTRRSHYIGQPLFA